MYICHSQQLTFQRMQQSFRDDGFFNTALIASTKTSSRPSCFIAEHSTYLTALIFFRILLQSRGLIISMFSWFLRSALVPNNREMYVLRHRSFLLASFFHILTHEYNRYIGTVHFDFWMPFARHVLKRATSAYGKTHQKTIGLEKIDVIRFRQLLYVGNIAAICTPTFGYESGLRRS